MFWIIISFFICRCAVLYSAQKLIDSNILYRTRISKKNFDKNQIQRESNWVPSVVISTLELYLLYLIGLIPYTDVFFCWQGFLAGILIHMTLIEFLYYWAHRIMHWPQFYKKMHKHHHLSITTRPLTSVSFLISEHIIYDLLFGLNLVLISQLGYGSWCLHILWIPINVDVMNVIGHLNHEIFPKWYVDSWMYNFFYTSSYHHVHHAYFNYNYALYMPIYDKIFGTYNHKLTLEDFEKSHTRFDKGKKYTFLAHPISLVSYFHWTTYNPQMAKLSAQQGSNLYTWFERNVLCYILLIIVSILLFLPNYLFGELFWKFFDEPVWFSKENPHQLSGNIRVLPFLHFHYIHPWFHKKIISKQKANLKHIAETSNIKVVGLAALNKANFLNRGGQELVATANKYNLSLVSGNTMTAAATCRWVLLQIDNRPNLEKYIYINGGTSSVGKAVIFYLASLKYKITFHSSSNERAAEVLKQAQELGFENYIFYSSNINEIMNFKFVLIGKYLQNINFKSDTIIGYFCVPPPNVPKAVSAAIMTYPPSLNLSNQMMLEKGQTYACHVGTICHAYFDWKGHEVGVVDYKKIDLYWEAAQKMGFDLFIEDIP